MSRRSPTGFVFSVAAEVIAVVFIVSVLPRVDLRRSAGASPTNYDRTNQPNEPPSLFTSLPNWPTTADSKPERSTHETSYYQRRTQPAALLPDSRNSSHREPPPLIAVDPARPDYVEQRLDRASQDLVNTVGSYVSQAATDLLQVQPPPATSQAIPQPIPQPRSDAPSISRLQQPAMPAAPPFSAAPPTASSFPTQPHPQPQPRPWVRY